MAYSFDHIIERKQTNSTKWLKFSEDELIKLDEQQIIEIKK